MVGSLRERGGKRLPNVEAIDKGSLADKAYDAIRLLLVNEEVDAGEMLCIDGLARQLNVSITPIREALSRLESEGLIDLPPNKQPVVRGLTIEELKMLYEVRELLEPYFMRLLADQCTQSQAVRDQLEELLSRLGGAVETGASDGSHCAPIKVDHRLGEILLACISPSLLVQLVQLVNNYILRLRLASARVSDESRKTSLTEVSREHMVLLKAILSGDARRIAGAVEEHLTRSHRRSLEAFSTPQSHAQQDIAEDGARQTDLR